MSLNKKIITLFAFITTLFNALMGDTFVVLPSQNESKNIESKKQDSIKIADSKAQSNIESKTAVANKNTNKNTNKSENKTTNKVANGATFIAITDSKKPKNITINKKTYKWIAHPKDSNKKIAFVAINYYTKPQKINLGNNITLEIVAGNYPKKEQLQIKDKNKVTPNKAASDRIARELNEANKIYTTYDSKRYWDKPFIYPLENVEISSPFGSARVFNGAVKSFHGGTDLRAAIGTKILAVNDGVVVLAKERFLAGNSVVVSHGEGVYSMYYHCSEIKVKVGQKVTQGEVVALSGDTGRVTAAHLHYSMMVNGVLVDGFDFIEGVNKLFE